MRKSKPKYTHHTDMKSVYKDKKEVYYLIDAKGIVFGRLASEITKILMGKNKTNYTPTYVSGDNVIVINSKDVRLTGKKMTDKLYTRYSGYPGGLSSRTAGELFEKDSRDLIIRSVNGMLPDNKLKKERMKRLFVFSENHDLSSVNIKQYGIK